MDEQKYYVGLKSLIDEDIITDFLWKDYRFYPCFEKSSYAITKSELAKIMGGAIYKKEITDVYDAQTEQMGFPEWVNPMIKLIPVKEAV